MAHLSNKKLRDGIAHEIVDVFAKTLCSLRGARGERFLGDLFTRTEVLMLAKRLALITLLDAGYSHYRIGKMLNISTSTITRVHRLADAGAFKAIREFHQRKKDREETWRIIELIARAGLPQRGARWKKQKFRSPYKLI